MQRTCMKDIHAETVLAETCCNMHRSNPLCPNKRMCAQRARLKYPSQLWLKCHPSYKLVVNEYYEHAWLMLKHM